MLKTRQTFRSAGLFVIASQLALSAGATDIADVPMAVVLKVEPNVVFNLDDSGSMQFEVTPDSSEAVFVYPRPRIVYGESWDYPLSNEQIHFHTAVGFSIYNPYSRFYRSARFNPNYYDRAKRYRPWAAADGSLMANISPTQAFHNPYNPGEGARNLTVDNTQRWRWLDSNGASRVSSLTFYPATYFIYTGSDQLTGPTDTRNTRDKFELVEIRPNRTYPKAAARIDCAGTSCTYAEEMQNFANWYSYYRSRILAARAGIGHAFARQTEHMRVAFATINKPAGDVDGVSTKTLVTGVRRFAGAAREDFFDRLYRHPMPSSGTPLRRSLDDVGKYFKRTDDRGPWGEFPGVGGGTQYSCRQNYHILTSDGYWGADPARGDAAANVDGADGQPYQDNFSATLADAARYYWKNDLRTDLPNNVPVSGRNPAAWQHMVNFTVGFGLAGTVDPALIERALGDDPTGVSITWPDPHTGSERRKLDDMAHAAVNSRGGFFSAGDPDSFANAIANALDAIREGALSAAGPGISSPHLNLDNAVYVSQYQPGPWSGDLQAYYMNRESGTIDTTTPTWSAAARLKLRTPGSRNIVSYSGSEGIQFQPAASATSTKLSAAQQALLNTPGTDDGAQVLAYLRGERSGEGERYRTRQHLLGDIVHSRPVVVGKPYRNYHDSGYAAFKEAMRGRRKMVYQGANDGMLHAFDGGSGDERWAYVPSLVLPTLNQLSRKNGFAHRYYVDGTPAVEDVKFPATTSGTSGWRTILVGGLNKGGRGYYALDVTAPLPDGGTEAQAAAKVLWEFPNARNRDAIVPGVSGMTYGKIMGYSFGKPVITKTKAHGWVVLITSGYNNGSDTGGNGKGYLLVLNAKTGAVIRALNTGAGDAENPSGLAQISAYVENPDLDNTTDYVYGGDLQGNVWRFDLRGASANWVVQKIATLVDVRGNVQPITAAPELGKFFSRDWEAHRMVYVGTGQYLGETDLPGGAGANAHASQSQTVYGLRDLPASPLIAPLRASLQEQSFRYSGERRQASNNSVNYGNKRGWYIDLQPAERISAAPVLVRGMLAFVSNVPNADRCIPGGEGWLSFLGYTDGARPGEDVRHSFRTDELISDLQAVQVANGSLKVVGRTVRGQTLTYDLPERRTPKIPRPISWSELKR